MLDNYSYRHSQYVYLSLFHGKNGSVTAPQGYVYTYIVWLTLYSHSHNSVNYRTQNQLFTDNRLEIRPGLTTEIKFAVVLLRLPQVKQPSNRPRVPTNNLPSQLYVWSSYDLTLHSIRSETAICSMNTLRTATREACKKYTRIYRVFHDFRA